MTTLDCLHAATCSPAAPGEVQRTASRANAQPESRPALHPEQETILRLAAEGGTRFWEIRRYLYEVEGSETRASVTARMIDELVQAGYVEVSEGRIRLAGAGR